MQCEQKGWVGMWNIEGGPRESVWSSYITHGTLILVGESASPRVRQHSSEKITKAFQKV